MLGEFVDKYTVCVEAVLFAMLKSNRVSVKVVDHDFKPNMLNLLNQTIR